MEPLLSLLKDSLWFVVRGLLLSSLVCPLHAGIDSVISFDLQAIPPASFFEAVTAESWGLKLTGDRKQPSVYPLQLYDQSRLPEAGAIPPPVTQKPPGTMSHHDRHEESPEPGFMAGLVLVLKAYESLQALFDWSSPAPATLAAGMGGAGGGDDGDDYSHINKFGQKPRPEFFAWAPVPLIQRCLKQKERLLKILHKKMQWAQACGNLDLVRILRNRIMLIEVDRDLLQQQISCSAPFFQPQMQEWLQKDSEEIQLYDQNTNDGDCQTSGSSFLGKWGRQATGSGGRSSSEVGATSKQVGQTGIVPQKSGLAAHHLSPAASDHEGERNDDPPPAKRTQSDPAAPVICGRCQKTLNEQEVTRVLRGSTAELVVCDACLHSDSKTLSQGATGKRKATRKNPRSDKSAPEPKRSKSQSGKRKQDSNPQGGPAAKRVRLEALAGGEQSTTDTVEGVEALRQSLAWKMNELESEAAEQLFTCLKNKKLRVKATLYKLLLRVDQKDFSVFCAKASVFFSHLVATTITDTSCLTSMFACKKKHIRDFIGRENSELEYLAGLDTLRAFSSMNNGKGLPKQAQVREVLGWPEWQGEDGQFSMERFRAFSSMNNGKGLPKQAQVREVLGWPEWQGEDGQFSMERFRAFSSMNNGKGLPKQAQVSEVMGWPEWQGEDGQFSMERFRAFSSMNHGKGLPKQAQVSEVLGWPEWQGEDGQFSMERFRAFSSMNSSRGLPKQAQVREVLGWPEWQGEDGQFSMERFRAFSSMNSSRGLPKQAQVREVLGWPEWQGEDGQFSMERFRAFSSMNHGKGLPKQAQVREMLGWPEWQGEDGQFSMERFRAFSSMNNGKGLPKQAQVREVLGWPEWQGEDGQFSMERFRAFIVHE